MLKFSCQICWGKLSAFHSWHVLSCCVVLSYVDLYWIVLTCIKLFIITFLYTIYHNMWKGLASAAADVIAGVRSWGFYAHISHGFANALTTHSILCPQTTYFCWSQTSALRFPTSDCRFRPWTSALRGQTHLRTFLCPQNARFSAPRAATCGRSAAKCLAGHK